MHLAESYSPDADAAVFSEDLSPLVLALKSAQMEVSDLPWLDEPRNEDVRAAENVLVKLGALTSLHLEITEIGSTMSQLPIHPRMAKFASSPRRGALGARAQPSSLSPKKTSRPSWPKVPKTGSSNESVRTSPWWVR